MVVDLILSSAYTLVFQVTFKSLNNISSTVRRRLRQIRGFDVINLNFDLCLRLVRRMVEQ